MKLRHSYVYAGALTLFATSPALAQDGLPDTLQDLTVEGYIVDTVARELPESQALGAEFLQPEYDPNLYFNEDAQVSVTFVTEGAGYRNALGYFSYDQGTFDNVTHGSIDLNNDGNITMTEISSLSGVNDVGFVFENASGSGGFAGTGGSLDTGDTYVLGGGSVDTSEGTWDISGGSTFEAGSGLGFFVVANGWDGSTVDTERSTYWSVDMLNPENNAFAVLDDTSDYARHVALLDVEDESQLIMGFEDLRRPYGDNDFNDAVFIVRTTPEDSYDTTSIATVSAAPFEGFGTTGALAAVAAFGFCAHRRRKAQG